MKWTNEKPTVPGWYWWKQFGGDECKIVKACIIEYRLFLAFAAEYGTYDYDEIGRADSQFAGPIPLPDEGFACGGFIDPSKPFIIK